MVSGRPFSCGTGSARLRRPFSTEAGGHIPLLLETTGSAIRPIGIPEYRAAKSRSATSGDLDFPSDYWLLPRRWS